MKEEAKEIVQAVTEAAKDRIKNPVMATFVISWSVFNWSSLLVLIFGNDSIQQKVQIASVAFSEKNSWFIPVFFTTAYLFLNKPLNLVFQKAMVWFDYISMSIEHSKKIKELELEKERESLRAEKDMAYEDTKTNKEKEIQEMKEQITVSKDKEGALTREIDELKKEKEFNLETMSELKKTISMHQERAHYLSSENENLNKYLEHNGSAAKDKEIEKLTHKLTEMTAIRNEYEAQAKRYEEKMKKNGWI
ncbi:hypothetical protein EC835_102436 [Providencia alcalifaciens]|uniref:Uncharacterized protein n=1 Tax=Providencia alcalifaciens TaxID=126385 RepID=A0A4R3NU67_9GAMM|nr:hypothetical protein [Providencia alcalifaciens]TCT36971.1 hypothetical protein EC835_102436 [Providencia alcalifaciens]